MKFSRILFWLVCLFTLLPDNSQASHLMGGNVGYDYIGTLPNGYKRYRVYLIIYRDCLNGQSPYDDPLPLCVFRASDNVCIDTVNIPLNNSNVRNVNPNVGVNCPPNTLPTYCIEQGYYETIIDLPPSPSGYRLTYQRCCRNNAILNTRSQQGQTYYAFIPNTNLNNSSPRFSDVPVPFICLNDTNNILNSATDKDGDSLAYIFAHPYQGANTSSPVSTCNPGDIFPPLQLIQYNFGYSVTQPFGATGFSSIDPVSGITRYLSTQSGNFIIAIDVQEWRNGVLISTTRRDIQFLVGACPQNSAPILLQTGGSGRTTISVKEGTLVNFPITIADADSVYVSATGTLTNPAANGVAAPFPTLTLVRGRGVINCSFNWQTACAHRRSAPYDFTIIAEDQGCPKKTSYFNYRVYVTTSATATAISSPARRCAGSIDTIRVNGNDTSTYTWVVTGATILSGQGTRAIAVQFPSTAGTVTAKVLERTAVGCLGDTITQVITVNGLPDATGTALPSPICSGDSLTLAANSILATNTYVWSPTTSVANPNAATTKVLVTNTSQTANAARNFKLIVTNTATGCIDSSTIRALVRPKVTVDAGLDTIICSDQAIVLGNNTSVNTYNWQEIGGTWTSTDPNPTYSASNNTRATITKTLVVIANRNVDNCELKDTVIVRIKAKPLVSAGPDITICSNGTAGIGSSTQPNHTYQWNTLFGLNDSTISNPTVSIANTLPNNVNYTYIVTSTLNGCSLKDTTIVTVRGQLDSLDVLGNLHPCANSNGLIYTVALRTGSNYVWGISGGTITANNNNSITANWGNKGIGFLYVTETDRFGCVGKPDTTQIDINRPDLDTLYGNRSVCPFIQGVNYWTPLDSGSTYTWTVTGGTLAGGQGNDTISVNWGGPGTGNVRVFETNRYGCVGNPISTNVIINQNLQTVNPVGDTNVCERTDSVRYSVVYTTGSTYTWSVIGGRIQKGQGTYEIWVHWNTPGLGSVTVVETSSFPCAGSPKTTNVNIRPRPTVTTILGPDSVCLKAPNNFTLPGFTDSYYQWFGTGFDSSKIQIQGGRTASIYFDTVGLQSLKVVEITFYGCTQDTASKQVRVLPLPISDAGRDTVICSGYPVTLGMSPISGFTYSWTGSTFLSSTNTATTILTPFNRGNVTDTIRLTLTATNIATGCFKIDTVVVLVRPQPKVDAGTDTAVCSGVSRQLGVNPLPGYTYSWSPTNGLNLTAVSNPILTLTNSSDTIQWYNYILTATEPTFGCSWNDTVRIGIKPLPKAIAGPDRTFCSGDTVQLGGTSNPGYAYTWSPATGLSSTTVAQPVLQLFNTTQLPQFGAYRLDVIFTQHGCVAFDSVNVTINPRPIVNAGLDNTMCSGDTIVLGTPGNQLYGYQWIPATGLSSDTVAMPKLTLKNLTLNNQLLSYVLIANYKRYGCSLTDTVRILLHPQPNTDSIRGPRDVCEYDSNVVYSMPNKNGSRFVWNVLGGSIQQTNPFSILVKWGAAGPANILVTETDSNGCTGVPMVLAVTKWAKPKTDYIIGDTIICDPNFNGKIYTVYGAKSTSTYNWFVVGGTIVSGNGTSVITVNWAGRNARSVAVIETNGRGCFGDTVFQNVYYDDLSLKIKSISTVETSPDSFEIRWTRFSRVNLFKGQFNFYYRLPNTTAWILFGGAAADDSYYRFKSLDLQTNKIYDFKVEALNRCNVVIASDIHTNVVLSGKQNGLDDVTLDWTSYKGWDNGVSSYNLTQLNNYATTNEQTIYSGSGFTYTAKIDTSTYRLCFRIRAIEKDGFKENALSNEFCIDIDPLLFLPTAFTPTGDGLNEGFQATGMAIKTFHMEIYNRWGERVFETDNFRGSWDGTYRGKEAEQGVYAVVVTYTGGTGKSFRKSGTVTLLR